MTDAAGGICAFDYTAADTLVPSRVYFYSVRVTYDADTSYTVSAGRMSVREFVG